MFFALSWCELWDRLPLYRIIRSREGGKQNLAKYDVHDTSQNTHITTLTINLHHQSLTRFQYNTE